MQYIKEEIEVTNKDIFFSKVREQEAKEAQRDLVIDPSETWKHWFKRTATFEEPPMIDRDQLPEDKKPSIFNKVENMMNGINPYPPGHKWNKNSKKGDISSNGQSSFGKHNCNLYNRGKRKKRGIFG